MWENSRDAYIASLPWTMEAALDEHSESGDGGDVRLVVERSRCRLPAMAW